MEGGEAAHPPPPAALEHYNRGRAHYQAGRYRDALIELEQAVQLDPSSPNLVFNVARVYELLGEIDHAIAFYKRYLGMLPASEQAERERTQSTLQRLEGARSEVEDAPPPPPVRRERGVADPAFWTVAGLGALTLAGSGALGYLALNTARESNAFVLGKDGTLKAKHTLETRTNHLALASDALLVVGATLGVTAILLYALREKPVVARASASFDLQVGRGGAVFVWKAAL